MLTVEFFSWWYSHGWLSAAHWAQKLLSSVSHTFSVPILLRTLFAPWRRIVTTPGASLDAKFRALGDNLISRAVGFVVRFFVLLTALLLWLITAAIGLLTLAAWPLLPIAAFVLLLKGIIG